MSLNYGKGVLIGLAVLLGVEFYLHSDAFLHRYRSVFAVGRAADKIVYVAKRQPNVVFIGNSRVDNGISPQSVANALHLDKDEVFNLGIPGQNTRVLYGVVKEMESRGAFSAGQIQFVLIGLDETLFSPDDELKYSLFFADSWKMLTNGEYLDLLGSVFRLWGYSVNLKGLREPARMQDFLLATVTDREPWGGSVRENLGYRAKKNTLKQSQREVAGEQGQPSPLEAEAGEYLLGAIDRLMSHDIRVGVFFTPRYGRINAFEMPGKVSDTYNELLREMQKRGVAMFHVDDAKTYDGDLYSDPGHLNEEGAGRYSAAVARVMRDHWSMEGAVR